MIDFFIALASRLAAPIFIMWLVAKVVLRGRRVRRRRRGIVPSTPSYQVLKEDAEVVLMTLAALPLAALWPGYPLPAAYPTWAASVQGATQGRVARA